MVANSNPGSTVTLDVLRNGQPLTVKVTLEQRSSDLGYTAGTRNAPAQGALHGVTVQNLTPTIRKQLEIGPEVQGVVVSDIDPGSPAAQYLEPGDVILSVNRHPVNSVAEFNRLAAETQSRALLRIIHQGEAIYVVISSEQPGEG